MKIRILTLVAVLLLPVAADAQRPPEGQLIQLLEQIKVLRQAKQESRAVPLVERALSLADKTFPTDDARYVSVLITAGDVFAQVGDKRRAEPLLQRAVEIAEENLDRSHPLVFTSLATLALFYRGMEDGFRSQPLYTKVVALIEEMRGPDHEDVAVFLKLLAESYYQQGNHARAIPVYERVISLLEKLGTTRDRTYFAALNDLAEACRETGDLIRAGTLHKRNLDQKLRVLGPDDASVATSLRNMGNLARITHNYKEAAKLLVQALTIYEKAHGRESAEVGNVLNQIGLLYTDIGDFDRAEPVLRRALSIREKTLGTENRHTTEPLLNLAWIEYARGNYARAEPAYLRALRALERSLGPNHVQVVTVLTHLAMLYEAKGDIPKAVAAQKRSNDIAEYNIALTLAQGTEEQKILYMNQLRGETFGTISLHLSSGPNDTEATRLALTTVLRRKGRMLDVLSDSLSTLRRRLAPGDQGLMDQLATARSQLAAAILNTQLPADERSAVVTRLEPEIARLEAEVSAKSADSRVISAPVTIEQVQKSIPPGATLLEFIWYQPFRVRTGNNSSWGMPRYAIYLLRNNGPPAWVDLGESAAIDADIMRFREALRDPKRTDVKTIARSLDEKIMRPVRKLMPSGEHVLVAPDATLNLIPFAALVDETGKYLVENYSISYLTSGRDLLKLRSHSRTSRPPSVFANPLYDISRAGARSTESSRRSIDFTALNYSPLPGTMEEATAIKAVLPDAQLVVRDQATEAAVKRVQSPRILHIATHGFFLPDLPSDEVARDSRQLLRQPKQARIENPLLRSGLVLAGVKQRSSGGDEDGVLTAFEASALDLSSTQLVILSACETGLGDIRQGEGIYGLRRSLVIAGSETQVISLWQVSDTATRDLMAGYYRRLSRGEGRNTALRQVQLMMLRDKAYGHPFYWASFIQSGAW